MALSAYLFYIKLGPVSEMVLDSVVWVKGI